MRTKVLIILLLVIASGTVAFAQSDSLHSYIKQAKDSNPAVLSGLKDYQADSTEATGAGTLPDPSLSASYLTGFKMNSPKAMQVGVSQAFPWMGTLSLKKDLATQMSKEDYQNYLNEQNKVSNEVTLAWLQYYKMKKDTELIRQNINNLQTLLSLSLTQYQAGKASMADVLKIKIQLLEAQSDIEDMQSMQSVVRSKLNELLNTKDRDFITPDTIPAENLLMTEDVLYDSILAHNPVLQQYKYRQLGLNDNVLLAKKDGLPQFSVSAGYQNVFSSPYLLMPDGGKMPMMMNMFMPGVGISIPIYRKQYKAMQEQASIKSQAVEFMITDKANDYRQQLHQYYSDYLEAQRHVKLRQQELALAGQSLRLMITDYSAGKGDMDDIIKMENRELDYGKQLIEAVVEQDSAIARIEFLMGR